MIKRSFWLDKIEQAWRRKSIIWLSGVRRAGKTVLAQSIADVQYFDCELPKVRQMLEDPEDFLSGFAKKKTAAKIVLDEIHRLNNPSELLKIAADHYPHLKILATGSSTLGASAKFKDTLTGRKAEIWLTPIITEDMKDFDMEDTKHRLLYGGLPPFFSSKNNLLPEFETEFQEWMDSYWAKDIQELFRLERRQSFLKFAELLMVQSGGIFEATRFTGPCEVSRTTITNYLAVLEATYIASVIRPFSRRSSAEIISAPKVYAFDTGFICYYRGWQKLRPEDMGDLWEHFVLNEMHARLPGKQIQYWRDKQGHEIDFVLAKHNQNIVTVECKWQADDFDPQNIKIFRKQYPEGKNFVVCQNISKSFGRKYNGETVKFVGLEELISELAIK